MLLHVSTHNYILEVALQMKHALQIKYASKRLKFIPRSTLPSLSQCQSNGLTQSDKAIMQRDKLSKKDRENNMIPFVFAEKVQIFHVHSSLSTNKRKEYN
uniref:Uncharacterized protein n=1 Tax=Opuntia streptacantha TaxID=393608 RepID=A0A7C9ENQ7_OPUST